MEGYQQQDILNEVSTVLEQASTGKRLANYLIDLVIFYLAYFLVIFIIYAASPDTLDTDGGPNEFFDRLLALASYGIFLGFIEGIFKGKTLGKAITGTKAVNEDGSTISFTTGFIRGLSRAVPFNAFSALGNPSYPWHDRWTKTYVIDVKRSMIIN